MESLKFTKGKLLLICLTVLAIATIAVTVFKVSMENLFFLAFLLACPLMHFFMMKGHGGQKQILPPGNGKEKADATGDSQSCH